ncbi:nucleotide sugar dehydrogenase [Desulfovibrio sp. X2]|uniref:nucleotide sugar dehydrogenase n=1 Tax=Desulfovibrio sp. X2 TaxID=941449 RepID=UPI00035876CF|nr:nucleotide sugar dehydrogenase [Desulfovibrio sp. X2]EPR44732.1 nucleotide sugar dehydrogenase [Desulfovibrio sp. X2]
MVTFDDLKSRRTPLAVVGLGYVGLPLAVALSRHFEVIGFDISEARVAELKAGGDRTREVAPEALAKANVEYTSDVAQLRRAGVVIVAVPTPIDGHRSPDLTPVCGASVTVGKNLAPGAIVCYESTVYPGLTEEVCVPLLEQHSGLACGKDFFIGYSPERINPGDKVHTLETIVKVVAGQTPEVRELLARVYGSVVKAGIHLASNIKVAEAAKVIENTQRDLNIALMNELSLIFQRLGIDTLEVLEAAGTKWNFLRFSPGLVGGHCIGVDPYYLTFKAEEIGYHPQVILAGRRINDSMGKHVAETCVKMLIKNDCCQIAKARIGVLGLTFKENVPDLRNTRVTDIIAELHEYCPNVLVHDPHADPAEAMHEYGLSLAPLEEMHDLSAIIVAVGHAEYRSLSLEALRAMFAPGAVPLILDVKGMLDRTALSAQGFAYWRL